MAENEWIPDVLVLGTDGSEQALRASRIAARLARAIDARLFIVTVVRPPEGWWGVVGSPPPADQIGDALSEAQRKILDETVASVDLSGIAWETIEEIGDPASVLSRICEEKGAGLLIVGRRGAGWVERMVIGSVADRVTREAPCPVLVVP